MKINKLSHLGFIINICFLLAYLAFIVILFIEPDLTQTIFSDLSKKKAYRIVLTILSIPTIAFWIYNLIFFYKNDRYSGNGFLLFFFNVFYSPFYYYKTHIKGRPLKNELKPEPVLNNTIILEEYEDEQEYKNDL